VNGTGLQSCPLRRFKSNSLRPLTAELTKGRRLSPRSQAEFCEEIDEVKLVGEYIGVDGARVKY
jgi:hypothetical protein